MGPVELSMEQPSRGTQSFSLRKVVTELAEDLRGTLSEFEELHARSQQLADRAFANVEIAQQASESLTGVLATYHEVIGHAVFPADGEATSRGAHRVVCVTPAGTPLG